MINANEPHEASPHDTSSHATSSLTTPPREEFYISNTDENQPNLADFLRTVVQRANANLKRVITAEGLTQEEIDEGLKNGTFLQKTRAEVMELLVESESGIGLTGGGDCAGIADVLSAIALNLDPNLTMLGVKNAGAGLVVPPEQFKDQLIIVDELLAEDLKGQSSTPFGSARVNALKTNRENTMANITPFKFVYGTGGDDHLGLLAAIAEAFPEKVVVGTFKSIDGDGCIDGKPALMLGFRTAVEKYQKDFWAIAQNAESHDQVHVVEIFGRKSGKLPFEATRKFPDNFTELPKEEQRKIEEFRNNIMILVPEKPTSLRSIAEKAREIKDTQGSCVIAVAEGFMPPELDEGMNALAHDETLKNKWKDGTLSVHEIHNFVPSGSDLDSILKDPSLAALFAKTVWDAKLDSFGNVAALSGIRHFIISALQKFGGISKVNELIRNYEARGATPGSYDSIMGEKIGAKMAETINSGITGGRAVVYLQGMDPRKEDPAVMPLVGVSNKNTLNNADLYNDQMLRENGVFWKE